MMSEVWLTNLRAKHKPAVHISHLKTKWLQWLRKRGFFTIFLSCLQTTTYAIHEQLVIQVSVSLEDEAHEEVESRGSSSGSSIKRNEEKRITEPKQAAPEERLNQYTGELRAKSLKSPIFRQAVFKHALELKSEQKKKLKLEDKE